MSRLKTDFSGLQAKRIGTGTFGAKTTELDRFKDAIERNKGVIPPAVSFPLELFRPALIRGGFLDEAGRYTGADWRKARVQLSSEEIGLICDSTRQFDGYMVAVRSDERTARGVGVFETIYEHAEAIADAIPDILNAQFQRLPNIFKRLTGAPHEIGIRVEPLAGETFRIGGERLYFPSVSVAGFTVREKGEVRMGVGFGLGGAVSQQANFRKYACGESTGWLDYQLSARLFDLGKASFGVKPKQFFIENAGFPELGELGRYVDSLCPRILGIADQSGTDIYFEAQLMNRTEGIWAITQIAEHTWPTIVVPGGKEILRLDDCRDMVGSGAQMFDRFLWFPDSHEITASKISRGNRGKARDALVISTYLYMYNYSLEMFEMARAILNLGGHENAFSSHVGGAFRETGKIVLDTRDRSIEGADHLMSQLEGKQFAVWADEKNEAAGINLL